MNADQPSVAPIFTSAETDATALGSAASGLMGGSSTLAESSPELMQGGAGEMSPDLTETELLPMSGGDDADKAYWMPLADLYEYEDKFFEDHVHMIRYFTNRF